MAPAPLYENVDVPALLKAREDEIRRQFGRVLQAREVKAELDACWKREGVNHYENCRDISILYLNMVKTHRVGSVPFPDNLLICYLARGIRAGWKQCGTIDATYCKL
ncbi:hypothetical protein BT69DRAFT_1264624 [Atractiella rhizophila]|nr:hypothetical protein BT69DRAFT_1264624 [Atractiella rhizophila]